MGRPYAFALSKILPVFNFSLRCLYEKIDGLELFASKTCHPFVAWRFRVFRQFCPCGIGGDVRANALESWRSGDHPV